MINLDMSGRVAVVTGGSRGIGRAVCLALAEQNAIVAVHYRAQEQAASTVVKEIQQLKRQRADAFGADLADPGAADTLMRQVLDQFGRVDILVNCAAEMTDAPVETMTDEQWDRTVEVNLSAAFRCCRACLPGMRSRQWGRIINVSSQAAYTGSANHAHYAATKAALTGFSYSLAKEVGPYGITVNLVSPGRILTDMITERMAGREEEWLKQTPLRRFGKPEEVAAAIVFLASDAASYVTGASLHVNGGLLMS